MFDSGEIHGFLDDGWVIRDVEGHIINRDEKRIAVSLVFSLFQFADRLAAEFEFCCIGFWIGLFGPCFWVVL